MTKRKRRIAMVVGLAFFALAALVAMPVLHLWHVSRGDVDERIAIRPGCVDDASRLNETNVAEVWHVPVDGADPEGQLAALLARAKKERLRVSIAGARHSMGGHTIYPGGIAIDMLPFNRTELDESGEILIVGSGALWKDVIAYLDARGRSVAIMQSNNSFSIGGSISVNCHGWQYGRPPIASTVESLRLMQADGRVVRASRMENTELFSLALGGYGLFGIILDVQLRVVPNERYRLEQFVVRTYRSLETFDLQIRNRPDVAMVYARMGIVPSSLFEEVIINAFFREAGDIPLLADQETPGLRRAVFRGSAASDYGKELRWNAEAKLQPLLAGTVFSRNQLLNEGVEVFENRSAATTDILHEYFVPRHRAAEFVAAMREIIPKHKAHLLNVTVRSVNEDTDTFLRYADREMLAFVMLFVQERTDASEAKMEALTQELIDAALVHEGRYYLPYRLHATAEQFHSAYPQARDFFELKRKYDLDELFQNAFYVKYGIGKSSEP